jgi:6-pyruvoyltetrahydropterin/6-carboxytetrahydropterin synthase
MFLSTKNYDHNIGLSCCFRQWKAKSHCRFLHGYALSVKFIFGAVELQDHWCVDFGNMKSLKTLLEDTFDHTLLVAQDDPMRKQLQLLGEMQLARVVIVQACGCEMFAKLIFDLGEQWLKDNNYYPRVKLVSVEVKEHSANSAIVLNPGANT